MTADGARGSVELGATGITVTPVCFGTLTVSKWQCDFTPERAAALFRYAYDRGVRFFDTAELYSNYAHLGMFLRTVPRPEVVVASKSYASTAREALSSVRRALDELGTGYLDVFLLHEQESALTLRGHREALVELHRLKASGLVRAVGVSTHTVACVRACCNEPLVEVIHPLVNAAGIGVQDGTVGDMLAAIRQAASGGTGIYAMKPLAGGHLGSRAEEALAFVRDIPYIHSVALGLSSRDEIDFAVSVFGGHSPAAGLSQRVGSVRRRLAIEPWCDGCGACVEACTHGALSLESGRLLHDPERCVLCGYCAARCPGFYLKVVSADEDHRP